MAQLSKDSDARVFQLDARTLVGRSSVCQLRLEAGDVSKEHAIISWTGHGWTIRDLGSRNGTFINNRRLSANDLVPLESAVELRFGRRERWRVDSTDAPSLIAETVDDGEPLRVTGEQMLAFVDDEEIAGTIARDRQGRWMLEIGETLRPVVAGEPFEVGGRRWSLTVPRATTSTEASGSTLSVVDMRLRFTVSGERLLKMAVESRGRQLELDPRSHQRLTYTLARLRLDDLARGLDDYETGWISHPKLQDLLDWTRNHVNVNVHRARKQLERAGFVDAACLIERRQGSGKLRLGVRDIVIERADAPAAK